MLDGGRIAVGLWGRRAAGRLGVVTLLLLGVGGLVNTLALFWALLARPAPSSPGRNLLVRQALPADTAFVRQPRSADLLCISDTAAWKATLM